MIITYDSNQDTPIDTTNSYLADLTGYYATTEILNITNTSFTIKLTVTLNVGVSIEEVKFLVSTLNPIIPIHSINDNIYTYTCRVFNLTPSIVYIVIPTIKIIDVSDFYIEPSINVETVLPLDLSSYTDMSYADIRNLDLSLSGLNMSSNNISSTVNFYECLVNDSTLFQESKHYYDYDLSKYLFSIHGTPIIYNTSNNITNNSVTIYCNVLTLTQESEYNLSIYLSDNENNINLAQYSITPDYKLANSNGLKITKNINNTGVYQFRFYSLKSNTRYYFKSSISFPNLFFYSSSQNFNTLQDNFIVLNTINDLSYADLSESDLSYLNEEEKLDNSIISLNTKFPLGKTYIDYPNAILKNFDTTTNNVNLFETLSDVEKDKTRNFFINNYLKKTNVDIDNVPSSFLGFRYDTISPFIKVIKHTTKTISISEIGSLKEKVLYKPMVENDDFELLDGNNSLKIQGPSGPSKEYFFYKNNVLVGKQDGIYTSGSIVDCFSTFNILNGYVIKLNSVEVSEYIYAELSGTKESYYGNTITYTIKLDTVTNHNLTFTLSNGNQIVILNGYTTGIVNTQLFTVQAVSITNVTGGQSHRVRPLGTVTCNILNINATLSTFNTTAYYGDTITYIVTLDQPTNSLLTFTMDYDITISVTLNQILGSSNSIITQVRTNKTLISVSGDGSQYVTLIGTVSTDITKINATLSCSNTTAYYGDVITYSVYLDYPTNEYLEFTMDNDIIIPVLKNKRIGSSNLVITEDLNNKRLSSVSGPSKDFVTLVIGTVSTTITKINATLSCSNTTAYYGDVITYTVNLDHPTNYLLTFAMDYGITIPILINETSGSSNSIITEVRNDKMLSSVSGPSKDFVNLVGTTSTDITKINATLSCSTTTAYYGDVITYIVNLDRTPTSTLTFTIDGKSISILRNQTRGTSDIIITENITNKTLSSVSGDGKDFVTLVSGTLSDPLLGTVSVNITNIEATLSCSNTTAYYGETITYIVTLDQPTRYELTFTMDYDITISVPINRITESSNSIIKEVRNNKTLLSVSGDGSQYVTLVGIVSTDMNKEILIENHYSRGEIIIPNVYISQNIEEIEENDWQQDNQKLIEHLRDLPQKIKDKKPIKGMYSLSGISEVLDNNMLHNFENDVSYIHVKPSHILSNKVLFDISLRSITEYVTKVQIVVLPSMWLTVGVGNIAYSSDGINWTRVSISTIGRGVTWNGTKWVVVGSGTTNTILYSSDGITWTGIGRSIFNIGYGIASNGTRLVAVGSGTNTIAYSSDGVIWTGIGISIFSSRGNGVAWNGTMWVAVGAGTNTIAYSSDGINWTGVLNSTSIFSGGYGIASNGTRLVAVGEGTNTIAYSSDGINWTGVLNSTSIFSGGNGVSCNGTMWVAVGEGTNTIAYSSDGINWTCVLNSTSIFSIGGNGVSWNGTMWVAVGAGTNTIAYSSDGINWTGVLNSTSIFSIGGGYAVAVGPSTSATSIIGTSITPTETNFIYTLESILFEPNRNYYYNANLFKNEVITDTVSGSFKTDNVSDIQDQTLTEIRTKAVKNIKNTIHIKYYYTITANSKIINCMYKCFSSNILTSISDTISWKGSYEVGRFSNELIKYPLNNNKIVEFNIVNANGIYKDIKKVKIHFEDRNIDLSNTFFHMLEFIE
jgi:hypothetical protein